jgi:hypothetical protein
VKQELIRNAKGRAVTVVRKETYELPVAERLAQLEQKVEELTKEVNALKTSK